MHVLFLSREGRQKGQTVDVFVYDLNQAMETIINKYNRGSTE
jgi:hypothetical protein